MTLYEIIYDFMSSIFNMGNLGASDAYWNIGGFDFCLDEWLAHSATIIVICLLLFVAFRFVWWLVRLVANGFALRK